MQKRIVKKSTKKNTKKAKATKSWKATEAKMNAVVEHQVKAVMWSIMGAYEHTEPVSAMYVMAAVGHHLIQTATKILAADGITLPVQS